MTDKATEVHEFVEREGRPTAEVWEIPRRVWYILASWGMAVLVLAGLFSVWIWQTGREADKAAAQAKLRQDQAMCAMIDVFLAGPEPAPGPSGARSRAVRDGMLNYRQALRCSVIEGLPR
jgi:hypothetical protein